MVDWRTTELSGYQRQLQAGDVSRSAVMLMAPNRPECWYAQDPEYDLAELPATFTWPLLPGMGVQLGANGLPITFTREFSPKTVLQIKLSDYDVELIDKLKRWLYQRERLRLVSWGEFILLGYLGEIPIDRPFTQEFVMNFMPVAAAVYNETAAGLECTVAGGVVPFLNLPYPGFYQGSYYPEHSVQFSQGCYFVNPEEFSL